jgi:hypothetical protein
MDTGLMACHKERDAWYTLMRISTKDSGMNPNETATVLWRREMATITKATGLMI